MVETLVDTFVKFCSFKKSSDENVFEILNSINFLTPGSVAKVWCVGNPSLKFPSITGSKYNPLFYFNPKPVDLAFSRYGVQSSHFPDVICNVKLMSPDRCRDDHLQFLSSVLETASVRWHNSVVNGVKKTRAFSILVADENILNSENCGYLDSLLSPGIVNFELHAINAIHKNRTNQTRWSDPPSWIQGPGLIKPNSIPVLNEVLTGKKGVSLVQFYHRQSWITIECYVTIKTSYDSLIVVFEIIDLKFGGGNCEGITNPPNPSDLRNILP